MAVRPPQPAVSLRPPPPTLALAGAETCRLGEAVVLGRHGTGAAALLAFDDVAGVAAWKPDEAVVALRSVALDGALLAPANTLPVAEGIEPRAIYALGGRFLVLLRRWDWQHQDLDWWGFIVDRAGHAAKPPVKIGLGDMDVWVGQALDAHRVGLLVGPASISKDSSRTPERSEGPVGNGNSSQPARWQTLTARDDGTLTSTPIAVDLRGMQGSWEEAELRGRRGWVAERDGVRLADGVFEGERALASAAVVFARHSERIVVDVTNAAVPLPPGPGGTIYEPMGQPIFERTHEGQPIGEPLRLEWRGNSVAHGMYVDPYVVWSGTHFIYPFWQEDGGPTHDKYVSLLLPIDCRPSTGPIQR